MGCEYFQGYYFHKPQTVDDASKLLTNKNVTISYEGY
jgi:EAL domain-containing protein (putative c-di-GMP-specific phosphodiesterase class I)